MHSDDAHPANGLALKILTHLFSVKVPSKNRLTINKRCYILAPITVSLHAEQKQLP